MLHSTVSLHPFVVAVGWRQVMQAVAGPLADNVLATYRAVAARDARQGATQERATGFLLTFPREGPIKRHMAPDKTWRLLAVDSIACQDLQSSKGDL